MKRVVVIVLSWVGALALLGSAFALLVNSQAPSYEKVAKEEFGSLEAIRAIETLYLRIEKTPNDPELKAIKTLSLHFPYSAVRRIPRTWIPQEFKHWGAVLDIERVENTDVLAYYDANNTLIAIEFTGTRYGCFISRDANRCPPRFNSLNRLAEKSIFITARIGLNPDSDAR